MCCRYTLVKVISEIAAHFDAVASEDLGLKLPKYNVTPTTQMPIIVADSKRKIKAAKFGLKLADTSGGLLVMNARAETIFVKPTFKNAIITQRCLVPATGYIEWKTTGKTKKPHLIGLKGESIFSFGGLCFIEEETGQLAFAIVTTDAPQGKNELSDIHNRMPLILNRQQEAEWLDTSEKGNNIVKTLKSIMQPRLAEDFEIKAISNAVNSVKNNSPSVLDTDLTLF